MGEDEAVQCNCGRIVGGFERWRMGVWDCGRTKSVEQGKQVTTDAPTDFLPMVRIRCKINGGMGILRIRVEWEIPGIKCGGNENSSESGNDGDLDKRQRWSGQI